MARLFATGFEAGSSSIYRWPQDSAVVEAVRRSGTYALRFNTSNNPGYVEIPLTSGDRFFIRTAIRDGSWDGVYWGIPSIALYEDATLHVDVRYDFGAKAISAYRNTTSLGSATNAAWPTHNEWLCLEIAAYIHATAGEVIVKINGQIVLSLTNVNTQNGGTGQVNRFRLRNAVPGGNYGDRRRAYFDDVAVNDDEGTTNNSWCGDGYGKLLQVNAAGDVTQLTPSAGSNYQCVDEVPYNTTDYVSSDVVDQYDLYHLTDSGLIPGEVVSCVTAHAIADLGSAGEPGNGAVGIKSGNTESWGEDTVLTVGTWTRFSKVWELNPDDGEAFDASDLDALQLGVKVR